MNRKVKKAFCPPEVVVGNPVVDYATQIVIGYYGEIVILCNGVNNFFLFFFSFYYCSYDFFVSFFIFIIGTYNLSNI